MSDTTRSIKIIIDNSAAVASSDKLTQSITLLEKKLEDLAATGKSNTAEYEKTKKALDSQKVTYDNHQKKLKDTERVLKNLSGATYKELISVRNEIQKQLKEETRGTEKYNTLLEENKRVTDELTASQKELRGELGCQQEMWSIWMGSVATFFGNLLTKAFDHVVDFVSNAVDQYAILTDEFADIRKTTGMTTEEVERLNESLGKIDTRTSASGLREIAAVGGQLGIAKKDIYGFTDSIDKLNVALGDEFGGGAENVAKEVGTLRNVLVDMKSNDISSDMLRIGNAINELGAAGFATSPVITDFTNRIGGIAIPLGVSSGEVLGLSAALQEMNVSAERGGTAVTKIMQKMLQDPSKFAKVAKMDVKEFTEMLNNDLMGALLKISEGVSKDSGSAVQFASILDELKLSGSGASEVFSKLGTNTDLVREKITLASQSLQDTNSIMDEFNIKNNTDAALQEKRKKQWEEISVTIGKMFSQAVNTGADATLNLAKAGVEVIKYLNQNKGLILTLIVTMGAYTAAVKLHTTWAAISNAESVKDIALKKIKIVWATGAMAATILHAAAIELFAGKIQMAGRFMKQFFATLGLNPVVALGVAIAAVTVGIYKLISSSKELTQAQQSQINISKKVDEEYGTQEAKINQLINTLNNEKLALNQRRDALNELKEIIPGYHADLTDEGVLVNNNTGAIKEYLVQLEKQIKLKAAQEELEALYRNKRIQEKDYKQKQTTADSYTVSAERQTGQVIVGDEAGADIGRGIAAANFQRIANNAKSALDQTQNAINEIEKEVQSSLEGMKNAAIITQEEINTITETPSAEPKESKVKKELETSLQLLENAYKLRLLIIEKNEDNEWKTEEEKQRLIIAAENEYLEKRITKLKDFQTGHAKLSGEVKDKQLESEIKLQKNQAKLDEIAIREKQITRDEDLKNEESNYKRRKSIFEKQLASREITQEMYDALIIALDASTSESRRVTWEQYEKDILSLEIKTGSLREKAIEEAGAGLLSAELKSANARRKVLETIANSEKDLKKFAGISTPDSDMQLQLQTLQAMYTARIDLAKKAGATEEELEKIKTALVLAQNKIRLDSDQERLNLRKQYSLVTWQEEYQMEKAQLALQRDEGKISEEDYQNALKKIRIDNAKKYFDYYSGLVTGAISAIQDAEMAIIDEKYDAEIAAAGDNAEEVARLENEKAQKKLDVEKKYADVNFAIKASEIIANTAVAIMQALAELGPIAGGIAAALMGVTGAAQLVVANKERQRIKSMTLSGAGSSKKTGERVVNQAAAGKYDVIGQEDGKPYNNVPFAGTPQTGLVTSPTLYGEQGSELVVSHVDFKRLEKHINYPLVISAINDARNNNIPQRASGKYDNIETSQDNDSEATKTSKDDSLMMEVRDLLRDLKTNGVPAYVILSELEKKQLLISQARSGASKK
ncbi:MAG: phage tail tape measure protein [Dysgonamonadaceae bacterium]|jgi:TP901 family phage tail tape measure protein|nr:phage tail tape measure protein [Dysgonamonadaceae bacterium]